MGRSSPARPRTASTDRRRGCNSAPRSTSPKPVPTATRLPQASAPGRGGARSSVRPACLRLPLHERSRGRRARPAQPSARTPSLSSSSPQEGDGFGGQRGGVRVPARHLVPGRGGGQPEGRGAGRRLPLRRWAAGPDVDGDAPADRGDPASTLRWGGMPPDWWKKFTPQIERYLELTAHRPRSPPIDLLACDPRALRPASPMARPLPPRPAAFESRLPPPARAPLPLLLALGGFFLDICGPFLQGLGLLLVFLGLLVDPPRAAWAPPPQLRRRHQRPAATADRRRGLPSPGRRWPPPPARSGRTGR